MKRCRYVCIALCYVYRTHLMNRTNTHQGLAHKSITSHLGSWLVGYMHEKPPMLWHPINFHNPVRNIYKIIFKEEPHARAAAVAAANMCQKVPECLGAPRGCLWKMSHPTRVPERVRVRELHSNQQHSNQHHKLLVAAGCYQTRVPVEHVRKQGRGGTLHRACSDSHLKWRMPTNSPLIAHEQWGAGSLF